MGKLKLVTVDFTRYIQADGSLETSTASPEEIINIEAAARIDLRLHGRLTGRIQVADAWLERVRKQAIREGLEELDRERALQRELEDRLAASRFAGLLPARLKLS